MRRIALAGAGLALVACSAPPVLEPTRYLMRSPVETQRAGVEANARIGLRRLRVAPYLSGQGLVLETERNEVRSARYHQWAEPLADGLRSLMRAELSAALERDVDGDAGRASRWDYAVDVDVDQLHGTASGEVLLVASWWVTGAASGSEPVGDRFVRRVPLDREGYDALAEAEIALARQLALAIAESLRGLPVSPGSGKPE